jgi:hypothetical protein
VTTFASTLGLAVDPGIDRILVNGRDVTPFRATEADDTPLKVPGYELIEPFGYGPSEPLVILRTNCNFEPYGTGDLAWLHKGARVQYQRVDADGNVLATDYRGVVLSVQTSGRNWVAIVAGDIEGRANLIDVPAPLNHKPYDLGSIVSRQLKTLGMSISPAGGPTTNITMPNPGNMTLLDVLQKACAWSRTGAVAQRAVMPWPWGSLNFRFDSKDTSTKDLTIFTDGDRITLDLRDDVTEQPNTVFGTCITSKGLRVRGARYPGLFQGEPAPYPFDDDRDFGLDDDVSDGDTDTGDGISRLVDKLAWSNLLNDAHADVSTYDVYVARAVLHLQEDAGLTADGVMTPATWLALWDVDVVGFSREGARIFPFAQAARIRNYNYSSTGGILGRNPLHQTGAIRVDRTIDFGRCEKGDAVNYARDLIHHTEGHEWFGTITFAVGVAVFSGEHDDETGLSTDDVMLARDIRPGMNAWLPYFDGGTLVHISGVQVGESDAGISTVTLTVDTGARDVLDISEALQRRQDSKRSFWRAWSVANRESMPSSNFIAHDEYFGKLYNPVALTGGQWNIVQMPIGEAGTVSRADIRMDIPVEFCWAAFVKSVTGPQLDGIVGSPFDVDVDGNSPWEHETLNAYFQNRWLRIVKGQGTQPCGYSWKKGYKPGPDAMTRGDRTDNPLTGTELDDTTWTYASDPLSAPVIYLAIYPTDDCTLRRGQLFYALEDDVT